MKAKISIIALFLFLSLIALHAHAANLNFSPASGTYAEGSTFSVSVSVVSPTQSINAVSGTITFPNDKLQVVSISKSNSIVSFWSPGFPSFSNSAGSVSFEGVIFNPGYVGANGKIITIIFKTKASAGSASVVFGRGSVLANDGQGTEVISSLGSAVFSLTARPIAEPKVIEESTTPEEIQLPVEEVITVSPVLPVVSSPVIVQAPLPWYSSPIAMAVFGASMLLLLLLVIHFGRKYHVLRRTIGEAFLEEEQQKNKVLKFLKSDVIKRMAIIKKLKYDKKLTPEEQDIILDIEKKYEI